MQKEIALKAFKLNRSRLTLPLFLHFNMPLIKYLLDGNAKHSVKTNFQS